MEKPRSIRQIIEAAGGASAIVAAVGADRLKADSIKYKWPHNGIPAWYWPAIIPLANSSADEMLAANAPLWAGKVA